MLMAEIHFSLVPALVAQSLCPCLGTTLRSHSFSWHSWVDRWKRIWLWALVFHCHHLLFITQMRKGPTHGSAYWTVLPGSSWREYSVRTHQFGDAVDSKRACFLLFRRDPNRPSCFKLAPSPPSGRNSLHSGWPGPRWQIWGSVSDPLGWLQSCLLLMNDWWWCFSGCVCLDGDTFFSWECGRRKDGRIKLRRETEMKDERKKREVKD